MAQSLLQAANLLFIVVAVASVAGWIWIIRRRATTGQPFIEPRSQREPYWSLAEFFVGFGLRLICLVAASLAAHRYLTSRSPGGVAPLDNENMPMTSEGLIVMAMAGSTAQLLVLLSLLVWMGLTQRKFLVRYGLWPSWSDLRLGAIASLFIIPPILVLANLLDSLVPYEHPVLDAVKQQPTLGVFVAMTFGAAIVAPIFEEFLFRALLQGGIQKVTRRLAFERQAVEQEQDRPGIPEVVSEAEVATWPWGAVVISSATFGILHAGHGAAPIALFFFAVALGYLYRQTGRLWPCITAHFALNMFSMLILGLEAAAEAAK